MIESVEELEKVFGQIETNIEEMERLHQEYRQLPWWALRRQTKNLDRRRDLIVANGPLWGKINEGLAPGVPATIKTTITQNGRVIAEGGSSGQA